MIHVTTHSPICRPDLFVLLNLKKKIAWTDRRTLRVGDVDQNPKKSERIIEELVGFFFDGHMDQYAKQDMCVINDPLRQTQRVPHIAIVIFT